MDIYVPYTYLIGWSKLNAWYYGVEYGDKAKIANPSNLWSNYFTSSKRVKEFRKLYGDPDVIQVRRTFKTRVEARDWEHKVLRRMKVVFDEKWLNKTDHKVCDVDPEIRKEINTKSAAERKGKKFPEISKAKKGKENPKLSERRKGLVTCVDSNGTYLLVSKEEFYNRDDLVGIQKGKKNPKGAEKQRGKKRPWISERWKGVKRPEQSARRKGTVSCVDTTGTHLFVSKEEFHLRDDLVGIKSLEARRRITSLKNFLS